MKAQPSSLRETQYPVALLQSLAAGLGFSVVVAWIATLYLGVDVPGSLVWPGTDAFCDTRSQGVGSHCFSDISLHLSVGQSLVPADPGLVQYVSNLPPGNRALLWLFQLLASWFGFRATLVIFLTLSAAALLVPALWVARRRSWHQAAVRLLLISVSTVPFLAVLERGNTIAFTVPLLLAFVVTLRRGHDWGALRAVVAASQIKPQLGLIVPSRRKPPRKCWSAPTTSPTA